MQYVYPVMVFIGGDQVKRAKPYTSQVVLEFLFVRVMRKSTHTNFIGSLNAKFEIGSRVHAHPSLSLVLQFVAFA